MLPLDVWIARGNAESGGAQLTPVPNAWGNGVMAGSAWMRGGAVAVSTVAFAWVVVQAQGGCGTESPVSEPEAAGADVEPAPNPQENAPPPATPTPASPPPVAPASATPEVEPSDTEVKTKPAVYFSASKSGDFEFDDADSAAGLSGIGSRNAGAGSKADNAGNKTKKPKAFFPASKSGLVAGKRPKPDPVPQAPNAPAAQ